MNVLMLSRYRRMGASSRLRAFQYVPSLVAKGFTVKVHAFFDDYYLIRSYSGQNIVVSVVRAYLRRLRQLISHRNADILWIEKEALPWFPWPLEKALLPTGIPLVTDFDDAIFHRYDQHSSPIVRRLLGRKIDRVMAASDLVIAGNHYLAERARSAGAHRVEIVPTVVDIRSYSVRQDPRGETDLSIGWIGTPSTWTEYMAPMMGLLSSVAHVYNAQVLAVGAGSAAQPHSRLKRLEWSEDSEVARIQEMSIGIMPLTDKPWARGKCGYKLIQYMACGLPVVASPVGVNSEIVEHGVNGFLASTEEEWRRALEILLSNHDLRLRMGAAGRKKVEAEYSIQAQGPRVAGLIADVARKTRP